MRLLAADVGGTKTLLALAEWSGGELRIVEEHRYTSAAYPVFEEMIGEFVARFPGEPVTGACLAVAGPLERDGARARVTNVGWDLDARRLEEEVGLGSVRLINDFQAQAYAVDALGPADLHVLQEGHRQAGGVRTVIGAGTGLGVAHLVRQGDRYEALASEGGHADFAPNGARERDLLGWLERRYDGHVSAERVLSGPGLVDVFEFLAEREPGRVPEALRVAMTTGDPAAAISAHALGAGDGGLAREALDLFVSVYGAQAGNLALLMLPYGGLYIAGGIAARILPALLDGDRFMKAFNAKGRMSRLTAEIPVAVVTNQRAGLIGALQVAYTEALRSG